MAYKDFSKPEPLAQVLVMSTLGHLTAGEVKDCPERIELDPLVPVPFASDVAAYLLTLPGVVVVTPDQVPTPDSPEAPQAAASTQAPVFPILSPAPPQDPAPLQEV